MADTQTGPIRADGIDKRRGRDYGSTALVEFPWFASIGHMRARLGGLATVSADGVNTVTVNSTTYLAVGQTIDVVNPSTGAASISNRQITAIAGNVVTYSGADATASVGDVVCITGGGNSVKYHTTARLNNMTANDMEYTIKTQFGDSAGV